MPLRPMDRNSRDDSMAHWIPTQFDSAAFQLIGSIANREPPVVASNPLVETAVIEAKEGTLIPLNNWSGGPVKDLSVKINLPVAFTQSSLASGKTLRVVRQHGEVLFKLDLDVADALILR